MPRITLDLGQYALCSVEMNEIRGRMRPIGLIFALLSSCWLLAQVEPPPCGTSLLSTSPTCPGDADGSLVVAGGIGGPFTYFWFHDPDLVGPIANGLIAGPYSVLVSGAAGCADVLEAFVDEPTLTPLGSISTTDITCPGANDGTVSLTVIPGPYTWQWIDEPTEVNTTRTGLGPGGYTASIEGGTCPFFISGFLGDPAISIVGEASYCPSDPPELGTSLEWGFTPDVFEWSTGETTNSISIESGMEGIVEVIATDTVLECSVSAQVELIMLEAPTVVFAAPDTLCQRVPGVAAVTQSNADSLVWRWGTDGFSNLSQPSIAFDGSLWQPISLQGFDEFGCGNLPVLDSVFVIPRLPATFTVEQIPCTAFIELNFASPSDSCAFFIGDSLYLDICSGWERIDMRKYHEYDFTFYSTRPDQCDDTTSISIELLTEPTLFLPTAFTPDGDGINDRWPGPIDIPETGYEVEVYDRWGTAHWRTTDTKDRWDGSALPIGIYVYTMRMRDPCEPTKEITKKGFVTLLR